MRFFIPISDAVFTSVPESIDAYWQWQTAAAGLHEYWGKYHWVLQTYLYLKAAGIGVELVNRLPPEGILISHMDCLEYGLKPGRKLFLVVLLVDREYPHPYAQFHVTHNPVQKLPLGLAQQYMPPWPQVGLIPRDASRGDRFDTIGYFGYPQNLDAQLTSPAFRARLASLGLSITVPAPADWHDFSGIDAILAIRSFGNHPQLNKPSLKLYNAWLARVPALLGHETSYRAEGRPGIDYLETATIEAVHEALQRLKSDALFRRSLVAEGDSAVARFRPENTVQRWTDFLREEIEPRYRLWQQRPMHRLAHRLTGSIKERVFWRRPGWFGQL